MKNNNRNKKILRFEIKELREKLLFDDGQLFYNIYDSTRFLFDDARNLFGTKQDTDEIEELLTYKKRLVIMTHSPLMLIVLFIKLIQELVFYIPNFVRKQQVESELKHKPVQKRVNKMDVIICSDAKFDLRPRRATHIVPSRFPGMGPRGLPGRPPSGKARGVSRYRHASPR